MNKVYEAYTEVDEKWVKRIPAHWRMKRLKAIFAMRKEKNNPVITENILSLTAKQGVVPYAEKEGTGGNKPKSDMTQYNVAHENDLLVNCMNVVSGAAGVSRYFGAISPVYYALYPHNDENVWYYHHIFRLMPFQRSLVGLGKGILMHESDEGTLTSVRMRISMDYLGNVLLPVPPRDEQDAIVRFLNWKVSEINKLINIKKKEIAALTELRRNVILRAATKGLGNDLELKDSGIDWCGLIPTTWTVQKIKNLFDIYSGATPKSGNSSYWNGEVVWVTPADFKTKDKYVSRGSKSITKKGYNACSTSMVPAGSIIFSKRAPVGTVAISAVELCTNQGCLSCVPKENNNSEFYYYLMSVLTSEFERFAGGTTFKELSLSAFANFLVPAPDEELQQQIVSYLNEQCKKIDDMVLNKEKQISFLQDFKTRLVCDVVTGSFDVREIDVPEYEFVEETEEIEDEDVNEESEDEEV